MFPGGGGEDIGGVSAVEGASGLRGDGSSSTSGYNGARKACAPSTFLVWSKCKSTLR